MSDSIFVALVATFTLVMLWGVFKFIKLWRALDVSPGLTLSRKDQQMLVGLLEDLRRSPIQAFASHQWLQQRLSYALKVLRGKDDA